jgi:hypothetical protein
MKASVIIFASVLIFGFASKSMAGEKGPSILFEIVFTNATWTDEFYSFLIDDSGFAYEVKKRGDKLSPLGSVDPKELSYMKSLILPASRGYYKTAKNERLDMNMLSYYCYAEDPITGEPKRVLLKSQAKEDTINSSQAADELVKWISLQHYKLARKDEAQKQAPATR